LQPLDATRLRTPKLQCRSEQPALGSSRLRLRTQQARGIPRNLQLDETMAGGGALLLLSRRLLLL